MERYLCVIYTPFSVYNSIHPLAFLYRVAMARDKFSIAKSFPVARSARRDKRLEVSPSIVCTLTKRASRVSKI